MTEEAVQRRIGGAVVDGTVRDVSDLRKAGFAMFCKAIVPRGPHHGFSGTVDAPASVGGVPVHFGDIVLVTMTVSSSPLERAAGVLAAAQAHQIREEGWVEAIRGGGTISTMFSMPAAK